MSFTSLHLRAQVGLAFAPGERVPFSLTVGNDGPDFVHVPDPFRSGSSLALHLCRPSGRTDVLRLDDLLPPLGISPRLVKYGIPPRDEVAFNADIAQLFSLSESGRYTLVVEYTLFDDRTWCSPEIVFERDPPAGVFLDVTPNEGAGVGIHGVIWVERSPRGERAILFDDRRQSRSVVGARELAPLSGAEPALSSSPSGVPFSERWAAWISGDQVHALFYAHGDLKLTLVAPPFLLPNGALAPRFVRPLLAEPAPYEGGRPRCALGMLAANALGGKDFYLFELDRDGAATWVALVPMAGAVVTGFALAPTERDRLFAFVLVSGGWVHVIAVSAPWDGGPPGAPSEWHVEAADGFLVGDLRARPDGSVRMGLVLRRGAEWRRVVFTPPTASGYPAQDVSVEAFDPPPGAEAVRARLDSEGRLHMLYRRAGELAYVPPGASAATWSRDHLGERAFETAHLILRPGARARLVVYDADHGPLLERL